MSQIVSLFINDKKTPFEIAELLQMAENDVRTVLKEAGYDNISERKYYLLKAQPFSKQHREFIFGSLLGNGKLVKAGKRADFALQIKDDRKDVILWKKLNLAKYVNVISEAFGIYSFNTVSHNELNTIHKKIYNNNKKELNIDIIPLITALSMAVFFIDRGKVQIAQTIKFQTHDFSLMDHEVLKTLFKINFDINAKICTYMRNNIEYHYLSLNKRNTEIFMNLIKDYLPISVPVL